MSVSGLTSFQQALPIGARVEWRREVYRQRFENRPIDTGTVVSHDASGNGMTTVRRDDGRTVTGPALYFSLVTS